MSENDISAILVDYFKDKPVNKVWLFGSFARKEQNEDSDIDLMIDLDHTNPVGFKFFGMWSDLEKLLGRDVDLVTESGLEDFATESFNRDKVLIYERIIAEPKPTLTPKEATLNFEPNNFQAKRTNK